MKTREVMNATAAQVAPTASVRLAADLMRREQVGIICVCDEQCRPVGVLTDRDIVVRVCAAGRSSDTTQVQEIMSTDPLVCRADDELSQAEEEMKRQRVGRALVLDAEGRLVGLITLAQLWHYASPQEAAPVSRTVTERDFRPQPTGGHYPAGQPSHRTATAPARDGGE